MAQWPSQVECCAFCTALNKLASNWSVADYIANLPGNRSVKRELAEGRLLLNVNKNIIWTSQSRLSRRVAEITFSVLPRNVAQKWLGCEQQFFDVEDHIE